MEDPFQTCAYTAAKALGKNKRQDGRPLALPSVTARSCRTGALEEGDSEVERAVFALFRLASPDRRRQKEKDPAQNLSLERQI